jgi:Ni/Fe-hydrogenase subunit HybB-like protein
MSLTILQKPVVAVLGVVLAIIGIALWILSLGGSNITSLSDYSSWGLAIVGFLFFEAIAAGCLLLASLIKERRPRMTLATLALATGVSAALCVMFDLGNPVNMWRLFFSPNLAAPMVLDVILITILMLVALVMLVAGGLNKNGLLKGVSYLGVFIALLLPMATAWMFTTLVGKIGWASAIEIATFVAATLVAGSSIAMLAGERSEKTRFLLLVGLVALLLCSLGEVIKSLHSQANIESVSLIQMFDGPLAGLYAAFIIAGVIPLIALCVAKRGGIAVTLLALLGVFLSKFLFIMQGNQLTYVNIGKNIQIPFLQLSAADFNQAPQYVASWQEWGMVVGAFGLALVVAFVAMKLTVARDIASFVSVSAVADEDTVISENAS